MRIGIDTDEAHRLLPNHFVPVSHTSRLPRTRRYTAPCRWENRRVQQELQNAPHSHHQPSCSSFLVPVDVHLWKRQRYARLPTVTTAEARNNSTSPFLPGPSLPARNLSCRVRCRRSKQCHRQNVYGNLPSLRHATYTSTNSAKVAFGKLVSTSHRIAWNGYSLHRGPPWVATALFTSRHRPVLSVGPVWHYGRLSSLWIL